MKWLSAGLTFVNVMTVCGLLEGIARHGLNKRVAVSSAVAGLVAALLAFWGTYDAPAQEEAPKTTPSTVFARASRRYRSIWLWFMVAMFAIFAFRSFLNVLFIDGNELKIQNPNNLGDLSLHITYLKHFASGVPLWPDNPIYAFSKLRYPAGIDLFNALLLCLDIDVIRGLVWVGLLASAALFYALYRWGGTFTVAGFLFNGGLVGFQLFRNFEWKDYQDVNYIAWKSLALTMFVTQRGMLYALPVGVLLLWHWRVKFFAHNQGGALSQAPASSQLNERETAELPEAPASPEPNELETVQLSNAPASPQPDDPETAELSNMSAASRPDDQETVELSETPVSPQSDDLETIQLSKAKASASPQPDDSETVEPSDAPASPQPDDLETAVPWSRPPLPFWVELSLYATMPLFHLHTFMALSVVLLFLFFFLKTRARIQLALLGVVAFLPATFFVWLITDHFHAGSVIHWNPGWVMNNGDFARPLAAFSSQPGTVAAPAAGFLGTLNHFVQFWVINFGITLPLVIALVVLLARRAWKQRNQPAPVKIRLISLLAALAVAVVAVVGLIAYLSLGYSPFVVLALIPPVALAVMIPLFAYLLQRNWKQTIPLSTPLAFVIPAAALFLFSCLVKTAPWEWDNIKLIIWSYLIVLPFVWSELVSRWVFPVRAVVCLALFGSGFGTLFGGLAAGRTGYGFADRTELDAVGIAVGKLPTDVRYAAWPIYNHPLLLQGRKVILGYAGHIWTQGFDQGPDANKLGTMMNGAPDWKQTARFFGARYLYWGRRETENYAQSKRPWEKESKVVATGAWGTIYDIESPRDSTATPPGK